MWPSRKLELLTPLIEGLCEERGIDVPAPTGVDEMWEQFRALVNTRPPMPASPQWLALQDQLLSELIAGDGVVSIDEAEVAPLHPNIRLWRGDITRLAADAIVNAANSQMLGCWEPGHACIDNAIHTFAGVQLRLECAQLMEEQGHEEPTGRAKITGAYNLPSQRVIHTVGPIVPAGANADMYRFELMSSYLNCLDLAQESGMGSLAFCCISTGVFGYPKQAAAEVAVDVVNQWLTATQSPMVVVFDVFSDEDEAIYRRLLGF